jgi:hypothetical protein
VPSSVLWLCRVADRIPQFTNYREGNLTQRLCALTKFVAPSRVRKTGRNGAAALASPTPIASICTLLKFFFCVGVAPLGAADQLMRDRFTMYEIPDACGAWLGLDGRGV